MHLIADLPFLLMLQLLHRQDCPEQLQQLLQWIIILPIVLYYTKITAETWCTENMQMAKPELNIEVVRSNLQMGYYSYNNNETIPVFSSDASVIQTPVDKGPAIRQWD
jgi:hypothetical protein